MKITQAINQKVKFFTQHEYKYQIILFQFMTRKLAEAINICQFLLLFSVPEIFRGKPTSRQPETD